jgi:Protein of unknown function (DUF3263)
MRRRAFEVRPHEADGTPPWKARALGAGGGTRTHDLTITSRLRFHLRHTGLTEHATAAPRAGDACFAHGALAGWGQMALTDRDREILEFEASWWTWPGPKARAVRAHLGMSPTLYYLRLAALVDSEEAMDLAPMVVRRLRRRRNERRRERFEGVAEPQHPRR